MSFNPTKVSLTGNVDVIIPHDELSPLERAALDEVKKALRAAGLPDDDLKVRPTERYLTVSHAKNYPFCRLKFNKDVWYISLNIGDIETNKNFRRIDVSDVSEVAKYANEIAQAFRLNSEEYKPPIKHVSLDGLELSPKMKEFFGQMEETEATKKYPINAAEVAFFSAYVGRMENAGLDWRNANLSRGSDGRIGTRGGAVKFRSKVTLFRYWTGGEPPVIELKGLSVDECISKLDYWIEDCIRNKEIYGL